MAFSNTFDSLSNAIIPQDIPVELIIDNHGVIINPNQGSYFYLDDIDENLNITLANPTNSYCRTVYLRLSFEDDNLVMSWPSNIHWYENVPPMVSNSEDVFISITTLDGGETWWSQSLIKVKPLVNLSNYMFKTYGSQIMAYMTTLPDEVSEYVCSVRPTSLSNFFYDAGAYWGCESLTSLDLSNWDTSNVVSSYNMFEACNNLQYLILNSTTVKFTTSDDLRSECKILVPSSALDTYKSHSAWSSRASQFDAIENYTIVKSNGTVTVTPNA